MKKFVFALFVFLLVSPCTSHAQSIKKSIPPLKTAGWVLIGVSGSGIVAASVLVLFIPRDTSAQPDARGLLPHKQNGQNLLLGFAIAIPVVGGIGMLLLHLSKKVHVRTQTRPPPPRTMNGTILLDM